MLAVTRQHRGDGIACDESRVSCQLGVCFAQALQELGVTLGRSLRNGSERAVQELVEQGDVLLVSATVCHHDELVQRRGVACDGLQHQAVLFQVLTAELAQTRAELTAAKIEGWRPEFDAMSPQQEELAMQFCQEIAGARGQPGNPPDPVRLLEMAQALYEAERADCMPNAGEVS